MVYVLVLNYHWTLVVQHRRRLLGDLVQQLHVLVVQMGDAVVIAAVISPLRILWLFHLICHRIAWFMTSLHVLGVILGVVVSIVSVH